MGRTFTVTAEAARRLTVAKQRLVGRLPNRATRQDLVSLIRDLGYVQWDPVPVVVPSHLISIWARLGDFRISDLEAVMWKERKVFLYWTPIASLVLTEDYPIYRSLMERYPESLSNSWRNHIPRAKKFLAKHSGLRRRVLKDLEGGPRRLNQFGDYTKTGRSADGWSSGSDVSNMLSHLSMLGEVMVVGHQGQQNVWGLTEEFLPKWADREELSAVDFERVAAQRAIRALGTASPSEIVYYYVRGRYMNLDRTLAALEAEAVLQQVTVEGFGNEKRYIHSKDLALLESTSKDGWEPRTSLIAPFDNLLAGRKRANTVFGFDYVHEQFLPKEKRRYGTWVLPVLRGERLIGRIDPRLDKERGTLVINSVHAEPGAPKGKEVATDIAECITRLAAFSGASQVEYGPKVPETWRSSLR